jgi:hypothetical protein
MRLSFVCRRTIPSVLVDFWIWHFNTIIILIKRWIINAPYTKDRKKLFAALGPLVRNRVALQSLKSSQPLFLWMIIVLKCQIEKHGFQLVFQWISSISDGYLIKLDCSTTCPEGSPVLWPWSYHSCTQDSSIFFNDLYSTWSIRWKKTSCVCIPFHV